jgi:hypothetical protein
MRVSYAVTATLPDAATRDEYVAWLAGGHIQQVIQGGASDAAVILLDSDQGLYRVRSQYSFPSRSAFDLYISDHAPALRADGLSRFPPGRGVSFVRELGTIHTAVPDVPMGAAIRPISPA